MLFIIEQINYDKIVLDKINFLNSPNTYCT